VARLSVCLRAARHHARRADQANAEALAARKQTSGRDTLRI
jgi:hypothetical protein